MNSDKLIDLRFLIPPGILILLLYLLLPQEFAPLEADKSPLFWVVGVTGIFAIGFLISSFSEFVFTELFGGKTNPDCDSDYKAIKEVKNLFVETDKEKARELSVWFLFGKMGESVNTQMHKRWSMAHTNLNSFVAICFAWLVALWVSGCFCVLPPYRDTLFMISATFGLIFLYKGRSEYFSVIKMQKAVATKFRKDEDTLNQESKPEVRL